MRRETDAERCVLRLMPFFIGLIVKQLHLLETRCLPTKLNDVILNAFLCDTILQRRFFSAVTEMTVAAITSVLSIEIYY